MLNVNDGVEFFRATLNRTLLELKFESGNGSAGDPITLNRTLLELKWEYTQAQAQAAYPSIVPYWN